VLSPSSPYLFFQQTETTNIGGQPPFAFHLAPTTFELNCPAGLLFFYYLSPPDVLLENGDFLLYCSSLPAFREQLEAHKCSPHSLPFFLLPGCFRFLPLFFPTEEWSSLFPPNFSYIPYSLFSRTFFQFRFLSLFSPGNFFFHEGY